MVLSQFKVLAQKSESFSELDRKFADLMLELSGRRSETLWLVSALVSSQTRAGHICLDLSQLQNQEFWYDNLGEEAGKFEPPSSVTLKSELLKAKVVGRPGEFQPLILDERDRLYLYRYWHYQASIVPFIQARAREIGGVESDLSSALDRYFPPTTDGEIDWQRIAAIVALLKRFCVITGGPGTGKTHTVGTIIALLLEEAQPQVPTIRLAAPTGKAAVRLQEAIKKVKAELPCAKDVLSNIPEEASTIHRLLGTRRHSPYFRHNAENPLEADVLIIDEASMVDLALMAKTVQALPSHARLILLGDDHQLASVEAGAILADLCDSGTQHLYSKLFSERIRSLNGNAFDIPASHQVESGIQDCRVYLQKSFRFGTQKGIDEVSRAVNGGDADTALGVLHSDAYPDIRWHALKQENVMRAILEIFQDHAAARDPVLVFEQFNQFRILCAVREGPQGVRNINQQIERYVKKMLGIRQSEEWYPGQPVLITENDYQLELYNGDVGIILPNPESDGDLMAHFPGAEGFRKLRPFRLPEFEAAYAMTVHKSQGSEFENVLLLLPERDSPILTRELIYTAITRARNKVEIWGDEEIFRAAVARRIKRHSGLRDALWTV